MTNNLLYVTLLICMASYSSALQCYVCNSHLQKDCAQSPVPQEYLVNCTLESKQPLPPKESDKGGKRTKRAAGESIGPLEHVTIGSPTYASNFTMCRKLIITIPDQENGNVQLKPAHTRVFRSCGWSPDPYLSGASSCRYGTGEGIQNYMCSCIADGCNTAGNLVLSKTFILFSLFSSFFMWAIK